MGNTNTFYRLIKNNGKEMYTKQKVTGNIIGKKKNKNLGNEKGL